MTGEIDKVILIPGSEQIADCLTKKGASADLLMHIVQTAGKWIEQEDGSWFWDGGLEVGWTFQFYSGVGQWVSEEGTYPYNDYKDLPNFDPDCHECPEWGWAPEGDIWYWVDPNGVTWIPDANGNHTRCRQFFNLSTFGT